MPIKPENMSPYPADWPEIRARILARAGDCCEECGARNHTWVMRGDTPANRRAVFIVLTIAHLDHQPEHNDPENLRALCQLHHNRHDGPHRRRNASATLAAKRAGGCGRLEL